jgi:wyosine [tRNA(Phe)-imidazoG37] synthetase (radical SAM superfamily)
MITQEPEETGVRRFGCVYGPVVSRRLGLSLGVDLVPAKTCCYNCIYCQLGGTSKLTTTRQEFFPLEEIIAELDDAIQRGPRPDVITLCGSGEPTLYKPLGRLIRAIRARSGIPVVLLTGGGLLADDDVVRDALEADVIAPSLDAGDELRFLRINRPHASLRYESIVRGLRNVARRFRGLLRIEVMLVPDMNDSIESLEAIAGRLRPIPNATIEINTPSRPVPGRAFRMFDRAALERARTILGKQAIILSEREWRGSDKAVVPSSASTSEQIAGLLARHSSTVRQVMSALGLSGRAAFDGFEELRNAGLLEKRTIAGIAYYVVRRTPRLRGESFVCSPRFRPWRFSPRSRSLH